MFKQNIRSVFKLDAAFISYLKRPNFEQILAVVPTKTFHQIKNVHHVGTFATWTIVDANRVTKEGKPQIAFHRQLWKTRVIFAVDIHRSFV